MVIKINRTALSGVDTGLNLGRYRVRVPTQGRAFNCMLSLG